MTYFRANIEAMAGYVPGEQPRGRTFIKLNTNECPYPPSPAAIAALQAIASDRLARYPDPVATACREAIAQVHQLPGADWVLAGNGSDDILTIAVRSFVDQGGTLATPHPSYSLYPILADIQGATTRTIPLQDDFSLPPDLVAQAGEASLLFIPRPNAPTGNAYPLEAMRAICADFSGVVLIDEAYADFSDTSCLDFVRDFPNVLVSRTLSKSYSLASIRFGYAVGQPELIGGMMKVKDSYNINLLTQAVAEAAIRDQDHMRANVARIRATRSRVAKALTEAGFTVCPSAANFLFTKPPIPADTYVQGLRDAGILIRYFSGPRTGDYVRITIGTDEEMDTFLTATQQLLHT